MGGSRTNSRAVVRSAVQRMVMIRYWQNGKIDWLWCHRMQVMGGVEVSVPWLGCSSSESSLRLIAEVLNR